ATVRSPASAGIASAAVDAGHQGYGNDETQIITGSSASAGSNSMAPTVMTKPRTWPLSVNDQSYRPQPTRTVRDCFSDIATSQGQENDFASPCGGFARQNV